MRSVCGREVERVVTLTDGGMNETYRVELANDVAVVARIARQPVPWFTDEEHVMAQARPAGARGVERFSGFAQRRRPARAGSPSNLGPLACTLQHPLEMNDH